MNLFGLTFDRHARLYDRAAGGHEFSVDLHQTNQAGIERAAFLEVAEGGDGDTGGTRGGQDALAAGDFDWATVDRYGEGAHRDKSERRDPKVERRPKAEIRIRCAVRF